MNACVTVGDYFQLVLSISDTWIPNKKIIKVMISLWSNSNVFYGKGETACCWIDTWHLEASRMAPLKCWLEEWCWPSTFKWDLCKKKKTSVLEVGMHFVVYCVPNLHLTKHPTDHWFFFYKLSFRNVSQERTFKESGFIRSWFLNSPPSPQKMYTTTPYNEMTYVTFSDLSLRLENASASLVVKRHL